MCFHDHGHTKIRLPKRAYHKQTNTRATTNKQTTNTTTNKQSNQVAMSSSHCNLEDFTKYVPSQMCRSDSEMRNLGVRIGVGHELRSSGGRSSIMKKGTKEGGYVVLEGHPCKIQFVNRSAQNLLRVTAVGLFDDKRRAATFGSVEKVFIPSVETKSNILATFTGKGFSIQRLASSQGLPKVLTWRDDEVKPDRTGRQVLLTVITACGYAKAVEFHEISDEKARQVLSQSIVSTLSSAAAGLSLTEDGSSTTTAAAGAAVATDSHNSSPTSITTTPTTILSKKEQRKLKKQLKKVGVVMTQQSTMP